MAEQIRILSANCQGLRDKLKRKDVINYLQPRANIICLQDTHLTKIEENELRRSSKCECLISGAKTNARGVAILINNNFEYKVINVKTDDHGNLICVDLSLGSISMRLINIYAPNTDSPEFFQNINTLIEENNMDHFVLCGDLNLVLDPKMDCSNYVSINNPKARRVLLESLNTYNLIDAYRHMHPDIHRFTWRRKNPVKQARLDYYIISNAFTDFISSCDINPGYRSDHSIIKLDIKSSDFIRGRGLWKFNCSLLNNPDYIELVNRTIKEVKLEYTAPVLSPLFIETASDLDITYTIEDDLLLEFILYKIRSKTIKFASSLRKTNDVTENELIRQIESLENAECTSHHLNALITLKRN